MQDVWQAKASHWFQHTAVNMIMFHSNALTRCEESNLQGWTPEQVLVRSDYYRVSLDTSHMEEWCLLISDLCCCGVTLSAFALWLVLRHHVGGRGDNVWNSGDGCFFFLPVLSKAPVDERVNGCCCSVKAAASGVWQGVKKEAVEEQRVWRAASVSHFSLSRGRHTQRKTPSLGWCWDYQKHFVFCESVTLPVILHSTPER